VAEDAEGLDALEGGPGVGRVAVVAEAADGLEALVGEIGVVGAEDLGRTHHLVDGAVAREGGDVDAELVLELDLEAEQGVVSLGGVGNETADLPEVGLLLTGGRAEGGGVDSSHPLGEDPEAAAAEDLASAPADLLEIG
jgi:hypothetical protein